MHNADTKGERKKVPMLLGAEQERKGFEVNEGQWDDIDTETTGQTGNLLLPGSAPLRRPGGPLRGLLPAAWCSFPLRGLLLPLRSLLLAPSSGPPPLHPVVGNRGGKLLLGGKQGGSLGTTGKEDATGWNSIHVMINNMSID